jgi:hypothetical protein
MRIDEDRNPSPLLFAPPAIEGSVRMNAYGEGPNRARRSASAVSPSGVASATGVPSKRTSRASIRASRSSRGSAHPYTRRKSATAGSSASTPMTTVSTPDAVEVGGGGTRISRAVRSSIKNGSSAPGSSSPRNARAHSATRPSGRRRFIATGPRTATPSERTRSASAATSSTPTAHAHGPPSPAM